MKFEEAYEIKPMLSKTSLRKSLSTLAPGWDLAPIVVDFRPICGQFEVDPGWISALDFWCRF